MFIFAAPGSWHIAGVQKTTEGLNGDEREKGLSKRRHRDEGAPGVTSGHFLSQLSRLLPPAVSGTHHGCVSTFSQGSPQYLAMSGEGTWGDIPDFGGQKSRTLTTEFYSLPIGVFFGKTAAWWELQIGFGTPLSAFLVPTLPWSNNRV